MRYRLIDYCLNPKVHQPEEIGETTVTELRRIALDKSLRERKPRDVDASLPFESWFEVDVFLKIVDRGYRVLPQFEVNTRRIDLVVEGLRGRLAVECNGDQWHGPDRYESDMARQRDLERCGWVFWTVRGSDFYRNTDAALDELWDILEQMKITPRHSWDSDRERTEAETTIEERIQVADTAVEYREKLDEHTAEDEEEREDEPAPRQDTEGRLDRALAYARSRRWPPEEMPPLDIQAAILHSLEKCPNHSCTLKSLTSRVLKELGVLTRSNPRLAFEKRVMRNLGALRKKGLVEEYKAKNRRIRLIEASQDTLLFH